MVFPFMRYNVAQRRMMLSMQQFDVVFALNFGMPTGARRLKRKADGIMATVVNGPVLRTITPEAPPQRLRGAA